MRGKHDWICRWKMGRAFARAHPDGAEAGNVVLAEPGPIRWWMYDRLTRPPRVNKLIIVLHGTEVSKLTGSPHRRFLFGKLLDRADCIGAVSVMVRDRILASYPDLAERIVLVPGAVRSAWRDLPPADFGERRREIIQVGRIHPRKGQLLLVQAMACLPAELRSGIKVRCIGPVGRSAYADQVRRSARSLGVSVEMTGRLDDEDLRRAYEQAAVCVMPSQPCGNSLEGLGIALLEAQHFACPVIGTRIGGIPEALLHEQTGILVDPNSPDALADALSRLLQDSGTAAEFGRNGARFVRDNFSWKRNITQLGLV